MTEDLVGFGRVVRQARQAATMTVCELASRIVVSYTYISIIELGGFAPKVGFPADF